MKAIAVFSGNISGTVRFETSSTLEKVNIYINLKGNILKKNGLHGFHIHEYGDLSDGCTSACEHYNPFNKKHGCPGSLERHVGDLGNLKTDMYGEANYSTSDYMIMLSGEYSIVSRMLIIHEDPDDCGNGNNEESLKTGNAGKRIACAVIGYCK